MAVHDNLGTRMKEYYEAIPKHRLMRRTPVAIRIDGRAFHTFTRGFQKPFDEVLGNAMARTMEYLCQNIQGAKLGYTQSDEITILLTDYDTLETDAWFDYEVQKICSVAASMATMAFNNFFADEALAYILKNDKRIEAGYSKTLALADRSENLTNYEKILMRAIEKGAMFDARCFNIPKEEACNLVYWRQLDAARNSVQMVGQANFSHNELQCLSCNMIQDKLFAERGINWSEFETRWKRGVAWTKETGIDWNMPILKGENRKYVDELIYVGG
jgi:tRNA(His) 5'-end guanylyltransferase